MSKAGSSKNGAGQSASPWGVLVAVLVFVMATAFLVDRLNDYAQDHIRAEAYLFSIEEDAAEEHIAVVEAIGEEGAVYPAVEQEVAENRRELKEALDELGKIDPGDERSVARVREALGPYEAAIDEQLALIESGRLREAATSEDTRVDPSFEALHEVLEDTSAEYVDAARRAALVAELATYATIFLAAIALTALLVIGQREQTRRREQESAEALRESEERYRAVVTQAADALFVHDLEGRFVDVNQQACESLGYAREELLSMSVAAVERNFDPGALESFWERLASEGPVNLDGVHRRKDGTTFPVEVRVGPLKTGGRRLVLAVARDVTERKRAEEGLRKSVARNRSILAAIPDLIFLVSRDGEYLDFQANDAAELYVQPDEIVGKNLREVMPPEMAEPALRHIAKTLDTEKMQVFEYQLPASEGVRDYEAHMVVNAPGEVLSVVRDVTERKSLEKRLEHQAFHDDLTGLPNRALFAARLERALARSDRQGGEVAVLFVDIDDFKSVNDSLGHWAGDELLAQFAKQIEASVRPGDTVARFGGDEFAVLLEGVTEEWVAAEVAKRVIEELKQEPFSIGRREIFAAPSIGIALSGHAERGWEDLLRRADLALHRAKEEGKARYRCFTPDLDELLRGRLKLEGELREALERGEFRVFYQPKVSIASGEIVGMEALLRWEHPERGLLAPSAFLAVAEETGLIVPAGEWVLRASCRQAKEWRERYPHDPPLAISVNLSAKQFRRRDLAEDVGAVLRECGLDPSGLTLEITESTAMEDAPATTEALKKLKIRGVRIEVDDFGTGYSSLSYLKRFPVDYLKVDRSFVGSLGHNPEDEGIVRAIVELAHTLGLEVVAEGVETGEQLGLLREMGCELAQGHYFWGALSAEAAGELLAAYHA